MSDTVISVEGLSKSYLIGHDGPQERYHSLRDTLVRHGKNYVRKAVDMARGRQIIQGDTVEEFWALKDVSFEVRRGEVLGIIGRNGAGKSTLLKVLSRITEPTSGRVVLDGRVASLLEVGTGFHPELTGRENIFLNGAILGMTKVEIRKKFDEIVDFSGVDRFLDTPVKRYSSGMYVRLAFAVAAHMEPEILIIDEVLAVGDAEFQKKCLGKMQDVAKGGRTVLFVSHNLGAIKSFCLRSALLVNGELKAIDATDSILSIYSKREKTLNQSSSYSNIFGMSLKNIEIINAEDQSSSLTLLFGHCYSLIFSLECSCSDVEASPVVQVWNSTGMLVSSLCGPEEGIPFHRISPSRSYRADLAPLQLFPGIYTLTVSVWGYEPQVLLSIENALEFEVVQSPVKAGTRSYRSDHGIARVATRMQLLPCPITDQASFGQS